MRETFRPVLPSRTYSICDADAEHPSCPLFPSVSLFLFHFEELDVEQQRRIGRNRAAGAALAVSELGRNDERARAADFHPGHALVPAANDLPAPQLERERLAMVLRAVELLAVFIGGLRVVQPPGVVHGDLTAALRLRASADLAV